MSSAPKVTAVFVWVPVIFHTTDFIDSPQNHHRSGPLKPLDSYSFFLLTAILILGIFFPYPGPRHYPQFIWGVRIPRFSGSHLLQIFYNVSRNMPVAHYLPNWV